MLPITIPYLQFADLDGSPLDSGYIYFGQPNQNPETAPLTVYWDAAGTQPAAQPVRTLNGYVVRSGTPAKLHVGAAYSVTVRNRNKSLVYFEQNMSPPLLISGGTMIGAIDEAKGADVASAANVDLTKATGNLIDITGTTAITSMLLAKGAERTILFADALTLTNSSNLVLPGGANIVTAAGDFAVFRGYAAGVVRCIFYSRVSGYPVKPQSVPYIYIRDEKPPNTEGGISVAETWNVRVLNMKVNDSGNHASLAGNSITLTAGTWRVAARAPACRVDGHTARLRNVTTGITLVDGANATSSEVTSDPPTDAVLRGEFTVGENQSLQLQHWTKKGGSLNNLGGAVNIDAVEKNIYSEIEFWKVG